MKKDVNLAVESGKTSNTPVLLSSAAAQVFAAASADGKGNQDFSAAAQFLATLAGVDLSQAKTKSA
jgi:3-hydroxyisobutyrate dehydrogenase-like beta-hydroxyacid dehydrogenase